METDAQVGWLTNKKKHAYEDRYRLLGGEVPVVARAGRGHLFAIMDGVGGAPLGMRAAQHVADRLTAFFLDASIEASASGLLGLCRAIDREVNAFGLIAGTDRPLGAAAATVAWLDDRARRLVTVHAGDTTAWCWDGSKLTPLTRDHGEGKTLARYVGVGIDTVFDCDTHAIEPGDWIVLATDGVTKGLPRADQISSILEEARDPKHAADEMTRRARLAGSGDDITALVVELVDW